MSLIAIIGFHGRFPGDRSSSVAFFQGLREGANFVRPVPADRWSGARFVTEDRAAGKTPTGAGAFIDYDYQGFDPDVFSYAPEEIAHLDPQQRLVLEVAWEALEQAAVDPRALAGQAVGAYVGGFTSDHLLNQFSAQARGALERHSATGSTLAMLANRLSHALDLRGPSVTVDTACASSLTALDMAVRDLRSGACCMALVGGVNFMLRPEVQIGMSKAGLLAKDGRSKPFSNRADGYGRGEGCGMLVLKPLHAARTDGDRIWAVVEGSGCAHGGRTAGISLPNGGAQEALMRRVLAEAGLTSDDIGYLEAHGTGTARGDEIEARSIGAVHGRGLRETPLPIGSMKANIGHLEAAAGVASVIKALMILETGLVPPHVLVGQPNPDIPFEALNLRLPREEEGLVGRRVAINAFGYGGANAHVILRAPTEKERDAPIVTPPEDPSILVPLAAQSPDVLRDWLGRLAARVEEGVGPADLVYTLARRGHGACRASFWTGRSTPSAILAARIRAVRDRVPDRRGAALSAEGGRVLYIFSGMGPQWPGMGQVLWDREPVFRRTLEEIAALLDPLSGFSLIEALTRQGERQGEEAGGWSCRFAQPANFAFQVGLVRLLASRGVEPDLCLGHSAGEVAAAHLAGHLSLEQAVALCWARSVSQDSRSGGGGMLAVKVTEDRAREMVTRVPGLEIAALNARSSVTVTGGRAALTMASALLEEQGIAYRRLPGDIAYHGADMDPIRDSLLERLAGLTPAVPTCPLVSTVTGQPVTGLGTDLMDAAYWWRNVRSPVRFRDALERAFALGVTHCLEIGAKPVLEGAIREAAGEQARKITVLSVLDGGGSGGGSGRGRGRGDDQWSVQAALAGVFESGGAIDLRRMVPEGRLIPLPGAGWCREHFWHEADVQALDRLGDAGGSPWAEPGPIPGRWTTDLNRQDFAFLTDHRLEGASVLAGAAALEAAVQTAQAAREGCRKDDAALALVDIRFHRTFPLDRRVAAVLDGRCLGDALDVLAYDPVHPRGAVRVLSAGIQSPQAQPVARSIVELAARAPHPLDLNRHRAELAALGLAHGPAFQVLRGLSVASDGSAVLAQLSANRAVWKGEAHQLPPCLIDGVFQAALALVVASGPLVPLSMDAYRLYAPLPAHLWAWITLSDKADGEGGLAVDALLLDGTGGCLACLEGIVAKPLKPTLDPPPLPGLSLVERWVEAERVEQGPIGGSVAVLGPEGADLAGLRAALGRGGLKVVGPEEEGDVRATVVLVTAESDLLAEELPRIRDLCVQGRRGRVYLITRNGQAVLPGEGRVRPAQTAVWGLGRVLYNEIPETATTLIDRTEEMGWADAVAREICGGSRSSEVAFRSGRRLVPRLSPLALGGAGHGTRQAGLSRHGASPPNGFGQSPQEDETLSCTLGAGGGAHGKPRFRRSRTYMVTGGLGGFGRYLVLWLARSGAGRILVTSRAAASQAQMAPLVRAVAALGGELTVAQLDLLDEGAVRNVMGGITASDQPLAGVFHWAGMIRDRSAREMTLEDFRLVLEPKGMGALALHRASLDLAPELAYFVLASSLSAVIGTLRQANYAAANAWMDGLAWARRSAGLPALSVNFGAVSGGGMAADPVVATHLRAAGLPPMTPETALAGLGAALEAGIPRVCLTQEIIGARWARYDPRRAATEMMDDLLLDRDRLQAGGEGDLRRDLGRDLAVLSGGQRTRRLADLLQHLLAEVLSCPAARLPLESPLDKLGLDSLAAIQFQLGIERELGAAIPITRLIGGQSLLEVATLVGEGVEVEAQSKHDFI
ncbi:SDR family NAD(P)-dependent oxidoreductase [Rhodospirillum sp. A1_3_36]|uniref:SDR family NAD(P)-dependent oxidoreductase n=1 Tax=Rhodospirillum sp. A1_3_36 TaxID=3391666 RepID=UPI0039A6A953